MRIRNARLRAYTEKEREQARLKTERERREKQLNADIEVYLKKNYPCEVSRVTVNDDRVEVSGDIKGMSGEVYLCEVPMFRELTEKDFLTVQRVKGPKKFKADFDRYAEVDGPALRPAVLALGAGSEIAERHADLLARPLCRRREGEVRSAP